VSMYGDAVHSIVPPVIVTAAAATAVSPDVPMRAVDIWESGPLIGMVLMGGFLGYLVAIILSTPGSKDPGGIKPITFFRRVAFKQLVGFLLSIFATDPLMLYYRLPMTPGLVLGVAGLIAASSVTLVHLLMPIATSWAASWRRKYDRMHKTAPGEFDPRPHHHDEPDQDHHKGK
jgi:hypothetical protein